MSDMEVKGTNDQDLSFNSHLINKFIAPHKNSKRIGQRDKTFSTHSAMQRIV